MFDLNLFDRIDRQSSSRIESIHAQSLNDPSVLQRSEVASNHSHISLNENNISEINLNQSNASELGNIDRNNFDDFDAEFNPDFDEVGITELKHKRIKGQLNYFLIYLILYTIECLIVYIRISEYTRDHPEYTLFLPLILFIARCCYYIYVAINHKLNIVRINAGAEIFY